MSEVPYEQVLAQVRGTAGAEHNHSLALARAVEVLKASVPDYTWVGIYLLQGEELVLGPFLGKPSPHTRIPLGRGICGSAATEKQTIVVDDVNADERYLACSLETRSEIVVPIFSEGRIVGEIDIDSNRPAAFTPADRTLLEAVAESIARHAAAAAAGGEMPAQPRPLPGGQESDKGR